ncbi:MAG: hypothetical protein IKW06_03525 [Clostridia bacterium]|nr:hypothetical protein [Clostridia bacterium]
MKKILFILLSVAIVMTAGCSTIKKNLYLPEIKNDKDYTTIIGGEEEKTNQTEADLHRGEGYTLTVPNNSFRYERDYDDGNLEEKWDYKKKDDVEIKVTTYKNADAKTAQGRFLREHDDYIFEDLMGVSVCGTELDGDALWFQLHETDAAVYIISWEYPKNTSEDLKKELSQIVKTFQIVQ